MSSRFDVCASSRLRAFCSCSRKFSWENFELGFDFSLFWKVTTLPDDFPNAHSTINDLRLEYVVSVEGRVRQRPNESINTKMKTGYIEV